MPVPTVKDPSLNEQAMLADGRAITEAVQEDYFGTDETYRFMFPDGITWIEFKVMTEGDRGKYQHETLREVTVRKTTGDTSLQVDPAKEREVLLDRHYRDWNLIHNGAPAPSGEAQFKAWRLKANPKLIDDIVACVREHNPFLITDNMTVEEIDKEIDRLNTMRDLVEKAEAKK